MIVVADTAPINYLIQIGQVNLLAELYGQVALPIAVQRELLANRSPDPVRSWSTNPPRWVHLETVGPDALTAVAAILDPGEREAIALAIRLRADLLLIDDRPARREAERLNLHCTGTHGVLLVASRRNCARRIVSSRQSSWNRSFERIDDRLSAACLPMPDGVPVAPNDPGGLQSLGLAYGYIRALFARWAG
jgi:predicted nucleic acid-binding protein